MRFVVTQPLDESKREPYRADYHEHRTPAEFRDDPEQQRTEHRETDVLPNLIDAGRSRTLPLRKPVTHDTAIRRETWRLSNP